MTWLPKLINPLFVLGGVQVEIAFAQQNELASLSYWHCAIFLLGEAGLIPHSRRY
jgi:hypothetical protein